MSVVLVTGAGGAADSVGAQVVALLVERGRTVRTLDCVGDDGGDAARLHAAVAGVSHVIHLAELRPPATDADQFAGYRVNVGATRALLAACAAQATPPRFIHASSVAVFGAPSNAASGALRRADEPLAPADSYGRQKAAAEALVRRAGIDHVILRLALTPELAPDVRAPDPALFEFHPDMRVEFLHPADAALALVNALDVTAASGRTLLLGGGARNRYRYLDWLNMALAARGLRPLPREAFGTADGLSDWVDGAESEALLHYQRHDYADWLRGQAGGVWSRLGRGLAGGLRRRRLLAWSRHHAEFMGRRPLLPDARRAWTLARRGLAAARLYLS